MKRKFRKSLGFSLIEVMIGVILGLLIVGGILSLFVTSKRSYDESERNARLQENGRAALYFLTSDLRHAGFWGQLVSVDSLALPAALSGTCGSWASTLTSSFIGSNDSSSNAVFACVGADIKASTGGVAVKRVGNRPSAFSALKDGRIYLRSDAGGGAFFVKDGSTVASAATQSDWEYTPQLYFIRKYSQSASDNVPALCRVSGNPTLATECLVEGIEDIQIEYGIDDDRNGIPERYDPDPTAAEAANAVTARVSILVRDVVPDPPYNHNRSYQLGSKTTPVLVDHFHRSVFSTTVIMPNQRNLPLR